MSHFRLLVIVDEKPTEAVLARMLQPFHEYECTGTKDEHVVFRDCTDEVMEDWNKPKDGYRGPDGTLYTGFETDIFYRPATPEEKEKIGPMAGTIGSCEGLSYQTVYRREFLLVRDTMMANTLMTFTSQAMHIPRGYRLPNADEKAMLAAVEGDDGTTDGINWKRVTLDLPEPELLVQAIPEGYEKVEVPQSSFYASVAEFAKEWHGYDERDGKFGRETNVKKWLWLDVDGKELGRTHDDAVLEGIDPDAPGIQKVLVGGSKWDWWTVGGRYENLLRVRAISVNGNTFERLQTQIGEMNRYRFQPKCSNIIDAISAAWQASALTKTEVHGLFKMLIRNGTAHTVAAERDRILGLTQRPVVSVKANSCQMRDLDLVTMQAEAIKEAGDDYDRVMAVVQGRPIPVFEKLRAQFPDDIKMARDLYWNDPVMKDLSAAGFRSFDGYEDYICTREEYVERARRRAFSAFAVLKDGRWYERGQMGWWGVVHNEEDRDKWDAEFTKMIEGLSPETYICFVDCHI